MLLHIGHDGACSPQDNPKDHGRHMQRTDLVKRQDSFEKPLQDVLETTEYAKEHTDHQETHGCP